MSSCHCYDVTWTPLTRPARLCYSLPLAVSFPIITTAPGLLGTAIGIIVYDEVSLKTKNLVILAVAITMACISDALIAKSL